MQKGRFEPKHTDILLWLGSVVFDWKWIVMTTLRGLDKEPKTRGQSVRADLTFPATQVE